MSVKKVLILTEAGEKIGLGHLTRCMAIYKDIEAQNNYCEIIIAGDLANEKYTQTLNCKIENWLNAKYVQTYINKETVVIIDSYLITEELSKVIFEHAGKTIFIDDNARLNYPGNIVVNPSLQIGRLKYDLREDVELIYGSKYIIVRDSFRNKNKKICSTKTTNVFIMMGGTDVKQMIPRIIKAVCIQNKLVEFNIVCGLDFSYNAEENDNVIYHNSLNGDEMANLMLKSDFAIVAAGQTIYELLTLEIPFIAIKIIENQSNNIDGLKKLGLSEILIEEVNDKFDDKLKILFSKMVDYNFRNSIIHKIEGVIDGDGSYNISRLITNQD